jgi:hypothetical protein
MAKAVYRKFSRDDQKLLATWAADCAKRVLPLFEEACPEDSRPREALAACRKWVRTGVFRMAEIRRASLGAHAAAREIKELSEVACLAARAAGQAVGTPHVPQHAYGSALYALKAIVEANPESAAAKATKEWNWQARRLDERLRDEIMNRILVLEEKRGVRIKIDKGKGF